MTHLFANFLSGYLTLCAVALGAGGALLLAARLQLRLRGERTEGEVVGHEARMKARVGERTSFMPLVRYWEQGTERRFQSRTGASPSSLPVGSRVPVLYLPGRPKRAEIATARHVWLAPAALILFGCALIGAALKAAG